MRHNAFIMTSTATLCMLAGSVLASTTVVPECIASQQELDMHAIASGMFQQLPHEHQKKIALAGGIGSEGFDLCALENGAQIDMEGVVDPGITAHEYLDLLVSDELLARLSEDQIKLMNNIADRIDDGESMPFLCFAPDTDREYAYAINQLLEFQFQVTFQQTTRWSRTATDGNGLGQGDPTTLTYSFVPDGTFIPNTAGLGSGSSVLFSWLNGRYGSTATWQALFDQVFDSWAEVTGLSYVYEPNDDGVNMNGAAGILGVRGDVRIGGFNFSGDGNGGVLAYNQFPNDGDMVFDAFDTFFNVTGNNSIRLRNVAAHEHGHGLGMLHVCPANQTKLMEPFVSTAYDGPQLDDILNGHRHYGDPTEPNDDLPIAIDMGSLDATDIYALANMSIDDNSDIDIFRFNLTERAAITVLVGPQAGQYQSGPQTQSCGSGPVVDYRSIQDLRIDLYSSDNIFIPIASANTEGAGGVDTLSFDLEQTGLYYIIVSAESNVNNVQRYQISALTQELPPVECPADLTGDGVLDFFDVSAFLSAFNTMNPAADFNNDGSFDFFDVSGFLNAFNAGCP
ncbi:MAG: matrixin family metalloprotease [Phycisphaerales bacterium]|nr:matrixin family metalloprotease [Phycisphaerales bacterium]